MPKAHRTL